MEQVLELEIPLPPLAEQKRIVALLDEAFAGIDEAKAKAEANLENGIALFQSHLNSLFAQCGETWIEKPLDEVLVKTETIDPTRNPKAEFDYIDVSSVSKEELVVQQTQRLLGKDAPSRARKLVRANDVIFATIRPTLRRIAIIPGELDGQVCSTGYFVLRPKGEIDHRWVFYFLQTDAFLAEMERLQKGASYPAVTDSDVRSQMIPMPSLGNQKVALEKLDDLRKETLLVSNLFEKKVLNLTELKSSLLAQAFAGELAV
jgi:type I restriction enzyme S subunit